MCRASAHLLVLLLPRPPGSTLFRYTTLFRSPAVEKAAPAAAPPPVVEEPEEQPAPLPGQRILDDRWRGGRGRSEEHTSELQTRENLVCSLLLEKKKLPAAEMRSSH